MSVFMKRNRFSLEPYVELDYIQSTGTQYINTDFYPKYNSSIILDLSHLTNTLAIVYGVREANNGTATKQFNLYRGSTTTIATNYFGGTTNQATVYDTTTRAVIERHANVFAGYNVTIVNPEVTEGESLLPLFLFALNGAGTASHYSNYRLYSCQIYDNGTLVRDYIPVQMVTAKEIGLWDKVERKFYGNAGTGEFIGIKNGLPIMYDVLDSIQSTGTQYIDTGFKPKYNSRVVADVSDVPNAAGMIFGARDTASATAPNQFVAYRLSSKIRSDYFGTNKSTTVNDTTGRSLVDKNKNILTAYGVTITNTAVSSGACTYSLYLFGLNSAGKLSTPGSFKLYSCQIYDNGVLVRDYMPVQNKNTREVGLWDKVDNVYYGNAGSGTFIGVKNGIPVNGTLLKYIESSGTQYINTGFIPNQDSRVIMEVRFPIQDTHQYIFGARTTATSNTYGFGEVANSYYRDHYNTGYAEYSAASIDDFFIIDKNKNVTTIDEAYTITNTYTTFTSPVPMTLFGINHNGEIQMCAIADMAWCKIYDNNILVRDYIPVQMRKTGEVGLWDKVNRLFYGNAGTGSFVAGEVAA